MKKTFFIATSLVAALLAASVGKGVVRSYFDGRKEAKVEEALVTAERQLNAMVPKMVDDSTRLDGAKAGPGKKFTYTYTLVSRKASEINSGMEAESGSSDSEEHAGNAGFANPISSRYHC